MSEFQDATKELTVQCPQLSWLNARSRQEGPVQGDEDCLFVNVYTPGFTVAITGPWKEGLL